MLRAVQIKNIKSQKRVCCMCERQIRGRGWFYIASIARGKYLCRLCEDLYKDIQKVKANTQVS